MQRRMKLSFALLVMVLITGVTACRPDQDPNLAATVGPQGGTASLLDGDVELLIDSEALDEVVVFTAEETGDYPDDGYAQPGRVYDIGPSGTTFVTPATVRVAYTPDDYSGMIPGVQWDELRLHKVIDGEWSLISGSANPGNLEKVTGPTTSLSVYGAVAVRVDTVWISPRDTVLGIGGGGAFEAVPRHLFYGGLPDRPVVWSSSDESVVTVDQSGNVTAVGSGEAMILGTSEGKTGGTRVYAGPQVASIDVTPAESEVLAGETVQFMATPKDADGNALDRTVTWGTLDATVATIDENGLLTGVAEGQVMVTASAQDVTDDRAMVMVTDMVESVEVTPMASSLMEAGDTVQLTAEVRGLTGNSLRGREVTWSSSHTSVATVFQDGFVTAVADGESRISATSEGKTGTASVYVGAAAATLEVTPEQSEIEVGGTVQLTAVAMDADGNTLHRIPDWMTSDTMVATVDDDGLVTSVAEGEVTITVTVEGLVVEVQVKVSAASSSAAAAPTTSNAAGRPEQLRMRTVRDAGRILVAVRPRRE